ncbi:hypothetical protein Tco_0163699 [Tanacetum coccineum]
MHLLFMREANGSFADKVKVKVPFSHKSRRKSIQELLLDRTMKCIVMLVFTIIIGTKTSGFMAKQNPVFQHRDSNAATISSCVISSSISFADPPQKDAAVQSKTKVCKEAMGHKKKAVVVTSDPLALVAEKTNKWSKSKEKVAVQSDSEGSDDEDISDLKKITALLAKAFNQKKYYAKPTNNNLRTSSASSSANKKTKYVKSEVRNSIGEKTGYEQVKCYIARRKTFCKGLQNEQGSKTTTNTRQDVDS